MTKYNKTELDLEKAIERNIMHRDYFAHYLRWDYVLKQLKPGATILDLGCGKGDLAMALYANKYTPAAYLGVDVSSGAIEKARARFKPDSPFKFLTTDMCNTEYAVDRIQTEQNFTWPQVITCFEVMEHIGHENGPKLLATIASLAGPNTTIYFSTPNHNGTCAANHMIEGKVGEWRYKELEELLVQYFNIIQVYGTFASIAEYKNDLDTHTQVVFERARQYLGTNTLSVLMASLVPPEKCRNCMWIMNTGF